jgi:hypothetical protein
MDYASAFLFATTVHYVLCFASFFLLPLFTFFSGSRQPPEAYPRRGHRAAIASKDTKELGKKCEAKTGSERIARSRGGLFR